MRRKSRFIVGLVSAILTFGALKATFGHHQHRHFGSCEQQHSQCQNHQHCQKDSTENKIKQPF